MQEIRQDTDLSKRVGLYKGNGEKNRDEIVYLAQTFDEMLEELEKRISKGKQFTSDVSHELRTPVSVILAQCEECLSDESFNEQQHKQVELIQKKARTVAELISHLLMLSRADQGKVELHPEHVNVSELLEMIVEEQQILAKERAVLYLNMEEYSGFEELMGKGFAHNLSDLLYYVRQDNQNLLYKSEQYDTDDQ